MRAALICLVFLITSGTSQSTDDGLCAAMGDACTFVLLSEETGVQTIINTARAGTRLSPFSTFKIANTAIALATGTVVDPKAIIPLNSEAYPQQGWWLPVWTERDHTLRSAYQFSVVPIYRDLATRIGAISMQKYVTQFDYGNKDISSGLDSFWLNGSLQISALEQVQFLQRLHRKELGLSDATYTALTDVMLVRNTGFYRLYAKTGAGSIGENRTLGWYVGLVDNNAGAHYFAINIEGETLADIQQRRIDIALTELTRLDILTQPDDGN